MDVADHAGGVRRDSGVTRPRRVRARLGAPDVAVVRARFGNFRNRQEHAVRFVHKRASEVIDADWWQPAGAAIFTYSGTSDLPASHSATLRT
jgi:hypothetical protein